MYRFVCPYKIHFIFLPKETNKDFIVYKIFICNHTSINLFGKDFLYKEKKQNTLFVYFDNSKTPNINKYSKKKIFITPKEFKTNQDLITIYQNNIFWTKDFILD